MGRTLQKWLYLIYERLNNGVKINTDSDENVSVQNPLSVDGDSIYAKDIDVDNSDEGTFTGDVTCMFNGIATCMTDSTTTNPKWFEVQLKRPMNTGQMNITTTTGDFSNVKIIFYDAGGNIRYTIDDSADNTKYTKKRYEAEPITFSSFKVEFHTADAVNIGFIFSQKATKVVARIQGLNATDGTIEDIGSHHKHLKVLDYLQSIGHGTTSNAEGISPQCAVGKKTGIGTGAYTLLEAYDFIQPTANTQMYLQSTDAQDAAAGTGIQEVTIEYFPLAWGAKKTVKVIPTGAVQVTISVADIYRIHKVYGNSGNPAQGDITITNQAETILYGQIDEYDTFMRRCIFYVAENEKVTVTQAILGSTTSGGTNVVMFATEEDEDGDLITRGCSTIEVANSTAVVDFAPWKTISNPNNVKKSVGLAVNGNLAAQKCTGTLKGFTEAI